MKFRSDYVTNSSSSSFVIAVRKGTVQSQVEEILTQYLQDHDVCDSDIASYIDRLTSGYADEYEVYKSTDELIASVAEELMDWAAGMTIEDWEIGTGYFSNEDTTVKAFIYDHLYHPIDTDVIKVVRD